MAYALQNGAELDYGGARAEMFDAGRPNGGGVQIRGELAKQEPIRK